MRLKEDEPLRIAEHEEVMEDALDCLLLRGEGVITDDAAL